MPIYEYLCKSCEVKFEQRRAMSEADAKIACPTCGSPKTTRALSLFAVGAESSKSSGSSSSSPGMCGRCGGPGPCASGY